jgi:hypothetical protein
MSSGSRVVPYEKTDGWTDMTKLTVNLRNFVNAPKILLKFFSPKNAHYIKHIKC